MVSSQENLHPSSAHPGPVTFRIEQQKRFETTNEYHHYVAMQRKMKNKN